MKYESLNKIVKELSNKNPKINNIITLENENELFRKYNKLSEGDKLITINFISSDKGLDHSLIAKISEKFSKVENRLYYKFPKYIESNNYFLVGGNKIDRNKTLEQNNINDNDVIILKKYKV
jgi:hypothetical protein